MKSDYIQEIRRAVKSPEYWFAVALILISSGWTAIYNLDKYGALYHTEIGTAEFFYACIIRNTLLQISVPILPAFASMHASKIYDYSLTNAEKKSKTSRTLSSITISASVFFISYLILAAIGLIFYPASTGDISNIGGPFSDIYYDRPFSIIPLTIIYYCVFAGVYSLFGMGISMNFKKNELLTFTIPLTYYFCFNYIVELVPVPIRNVLYEVMPLDTFSIFATDIPLHKKISEMIFVLVIAIVLIAVAKPNNKENKCKNEPVTKKYCKTDEMGISKVL